MSKIKDPSLASSGLLELEWAKKNMPLLSKITRDFEKGKPFEGINISVALHLEKKTGVLLLALAAGGARVYASSCNPLTTDDSVAAALSKEGIEVFAWSGQTRKEYYSCFNWVLDAKPHIIIDDGCDLINLVHFSRKDASSKLLGACEETTTGVLRLLAMQKAGKLSIPVFAVNNAYSKFLLDNQFGTAQSTVEAISRATNKLIAGKTVVVVGYGWCGRGIASRMKAMGANVIVVEADVQAEAGPSGAHKALLALYEGFRVMPMKQAAKEGDIFITATGNTSVISAPHFSLMKDGAILCNAGHFDVEIDQAALHKASKRIWKVKENITAYQLKSGKILYLLSEGRLVNLARPAGQGHPIEIMDGSFALQALCCRLLATQKPPSPGVHPVPWQIDTQVARMILESAGIKLEKLSEKQRKYLQDFAYGT
ncbi:MAG: adenosylhomocysteinase [Candidatus Anstonellaceae archaeon]